MVGIIGFVDEARWPSGAQSGDFIELYLRRIHDFYHPDRRMFDNATQRAVQNFFENGGDICHVFAVCIDSFDDLRLPSGIVGVLSPLLDRLRSEEDLALLLVPSAAYMRCHVDADGGVRADVEALYDELLEHCREMNNRFLIMDAPEVFTVDCWSAGSRNGSAPGESCVWSHLLPMASSRDAFHPFIRCWNIARVENEHGTFGVMCPQPTCHCEV